MKIPVVDDTTAKREDPLRHFLHGLPHNVTVSVGEKDHCIRRGLHRLNEIRVEDEDASVEPREFDHALHRLLQKKRGGHPLRRNDDSSSERRQPQRTSPG